MLVLSRKVGETIIVRDDVEILVSRIERDEVRIKIRAPRELSVFKGELYREIQRQKNGNPEPAIDQDMMVDYPPDPPEG